MTDINPGYVLAQLERALQAAAAHEDPAVRERAKERFAKWRSVALGIASGSLDIGSRTPTAAPAWATLEVVHGGFATGALAAEGPLLEHEHEIAARRDILTDRRLLSLYFLSDEGRAELRALLAESRFRIDVPEEGALLCVVALLDHGMSERAADVIDAIAPYLHRLRFYPQPAVRPFAPTLTVHLASVGETRARIATVETPLPIRKMREALGVWAPLTDRAADLFLETFADGAPCRRFATDWQARARTLVQEHAAARDAHRLCTRPHRPSENLAILISAAARITGGGELDGRELGLVRVAAEGHARKHGEPGSPQRQARCDQRARIVSSPHRGASAMVLADRLGHLPQDIGIGSMEPIAAPMSEAEASAMRLEAGTPIWPTVAAKLARCLDASVEELVERGVLTSGEAIARVLPQMSAHVRASSFVDPRIARLHAAIDAAFRRRRSLLLLDYSSQVKLEELPWIAALAPLRLPDTGSLESARQLFSNLVSLVVAWFPQAIVPNPLLNELRTLAQHAGIELPIVDELAADIFRGGFTAKFVRAAAIAAGRLDGTLYARYYSLPVAEIRQIAASLSAPELGVPVPAFGELCQRRAALEPATHGSVARNGRIIEQQQILTTQNLVPLIHAAGLDTAGFPELAKRAFEWMVRRIAARPPHYIDELRNAKNVSYAWRQAIAFLSLGPPGAVEGFLAFARAHAQDDPRWAPILDCLAEAAQGRTPQTVLLGWTTTQHPLVSHRP